MQRKYDNSNALSFSANTFYTILAQHEYTSDYILSLNMKFGK